VDKHVIVIASATFSTKEIGHAEIFDPEPINFSPFVEDYWKTEKCWCKVSPSGFSEDCV
jgi:hypothetical protein